MAFLDQDIFSLCNPFGYFCLLWDKNLVTEIICRGWTLILFLNKNPCISLGTGIFQFSTFLSYFFSEWLEVYWSLWAFFSFLKFFFFKLSSNSDFQLYCFCFHNLHQKCFFLIILFFVMFSHQFLDYPSCLVVCLNNINRFDSHWVSHTCGIKYYIENSD